jgi:hypothetical protein
MHQGYLDDLKVSHLKVNESVELIIVKPVNVLIASHIEGRVHQFLD